MTGSHVLCGNNNFQFSTSNLSSGSLLQFFTLISNMGVAPRSTYPFGRADTTPPSPSTHFRQQKQCNFEEEFLKMQPWSFSIQVPKILLKNDPPGQVRVRIPVETILFFLYFSFFLFLSLISFAFLPIHIIRYQSKYNFGISGFISSQKIVSTFIRLCL